MTLVQLEYIVALNNCRHFATAADRCFVTQPTLSMQVQKLEEELGITLFDRSKQPVIPTETGREIIEQAKRVLAEKNKLVEITQAKKGIMAGELRIGIIPTLAPYLLPLFVPSFNKKYPGIKLVVNEMMTEYIISRLRQGRIDAGILVTPLQEKGIREHVLFYEELLAYISRKNSAYHKTYVLPQDIDPSKLWLMEEGHCFRSQIMNLCELRRSAAMNQHFEYEAGSIETLRRMVELNDGITILPELATAEMSARQLQQIRHFKKPAPMREVSIVLHRDIVKRRLLEALKKVILDALPETVKKNSSMHVVPV